MPIIEKKQKVDLKKAGISNIVAGLSWNIEDPYPENYFIDLYAYLLDENEKCNANEVIHLGNTEKRTRDSIQFKYLGIDELIHNKKLGSEDFQQILVGLDVVPPEIKKIVFCASVADYEINKYTLSQVKNLRFTIFEESSLEILVETPYKNEFKSESVLIVGELQREFNGWSYNGINEGYSVPLSVINSLYLEKVIE